MVATDKNTQIRHLENHILDLKTTLALLQETELLQKEKVSQSNSSKRLVQVNANKAEIDRRIAAFIEMKRSQVDEMNLREFCSVITPSLERESTGCARTDAVLLNRIGRKSHVKLTRVVSDVTSTGTGGTRENEVTKGNDFVSSALDERLSSMEQHLNLKPGGPIPEDIYARVKSLECRILELESRSPEYGSAMESGHHTPSTSEGKHQLELKTLSDGEIDRSIADLEKQLGRKRRKRSSEERIDEKASH